VLVFVGHLILKLAEWSSTRLCDISGSEPDLQFMHIEKFCFTISLHLLRTSWAVANIIRVKCDIESGKLLELVMYKGSTTFRNFHALWVTNG